MAYSVAMTFDPTPDQPHVICFLQGDKVHPCFASLRFPGVDKKYAIYATRDEADENIMEWQGGMTNPYFSIPAAALFAVEPKTGYTFTRK